MYHGTFGTKVNKAPLFLDLFPGAKVAYSLRKLRQDYYGNCIQIQNDAGATLDIPFYEDYFDFQYAEDFLKNSARGYVTKLYDQSGNGNDATLSISAAPGAASIFTDGKINYRNGRVIIKALASSPGYYLFTSFSAVTDFSSFVVQKRNASAVDGWYFSSTSRGVIAGGQYRDNNVYLQVVRATGVGNGTSYSVAQNTTDYNLLSGYYRISPLVAEVWKNGVKLTLSGGTGFNPNGLNFNTIGQYNSAGVSAAQAELSEAVLYTKNMSDAAKAMNENIMRFYGL